MIIAKILDKIFQNKNGIMLIDPKGEKYICGKPNEKKPLKIKLYKKNLIWKLVLNPELEFAEAYMNGDLKIENGSLKDFLMLLLENLGRKEITNFSYILKTISRFWRFLTNFNYPLKSKKDIQYHYDVGGQKGEKLYDIFLDKNHRQYSCAYWRSDDETLEQAQQNKLDHIIKKLDIKPGQKVLDVGCGWGGLSFEIAKQKNCEVLGVSLSKNQVEYCKSKVKDLGLHNKLKFELEDYRKIKGKFDRIVSVGMFEHVGKKFYTKYFNTIKNLLKENGKFLLHTIASVDKPGPGNEFIGKYIFPGGVVPTFSEVIKPIENTGLIISDTESLIRHYDKTLSSWLKRFLNKAEEVKNLYDEKFVRMWEFYLASCAAAFRHRDLCVLQLLIVNNFENAPKTRDYIYS